MADKYRVGIIGCGSIARAPCTLAYRGVEEVEIVAIADPVAGCTECFRGKPQRSDTLS